MTAMRRVVWALLFLAGCMRGCNPSCNSSCNSGGSGRDPSCTTTGDCEDNERCHEGICKDQDSIQRSERCLDTPGCKRQGACRPGLTRSFLGATSQPTCLVERAEDCAASELCKSQGKCGLAETGFYKDGYCAATTAKHCADSARCATHDECSLLEEHKVCNRKWLGCTGETPMIGFEPAHDLGAPWQPGEVADAAIACRLEDDYKQTTSFVRIGKTCVRGPTLGANTPFLFRHKLAPKDRIEVAIQGTAEVGTWYDAGYVRAEYTGESVFTSGSELPKLTCTVVSPEVARRNAAGMVTRIERGFVRLAAEQANPKYLVAEPREAGGIRRVMAEAILWLGDDPQVAKLKASFEAGLVVWRKKLDAAIGALELSDLGPKGARISVHGVVCGDDLEIRTKQASLGKDDCGVELAIKVTEQMTIGAGINDLGTLEFARRGPDATIIRGEVVDARMQTDRNVAGAVTAKPGDEVIALVVPQTFYPLGGRLIGNGYSAQRLTVSLDR